MNRSTRPALPLRRLATVITTALTTAALAGLVPTPAHAATALHGTLGLQGGACTGGTVSGSYFRMILHSGGPTGPFLSNSSSACSDQTYSLLAPGKDGGLVTGAYQAQPSPAFDSSGNGRADRITQPTRFYGVDFAAATNGVDPQTGAKVPPPQVSVQGTSLSADLRSFAVSWNDQQFNQGAPKPDGSQPGNTRPATGTYDARTGAFTLQWTSQIQGGPFDGFTGLWHLTGHVTTAPTPATGGTAASASTAPRATAPARTSSPSVTATPTGGPGSTSASTSASTSPATSASTGASGPPPGPGTPQATSAVARATTGTGDTPSTTLAGSTTPPGTASWPWALVATAAAIAAGALVLAQRRRSRR